MADLPAGLAADQGPVEPAPAPRGCLRRLFEVVQTLALAGVLFLGINAISARIRVESISMIPTLSPMNFVIVEKLSYWFAEPQRGDIVIFTLPQDPSQRYIKRVIGLPGEEIVLRGGEVFIDGARLVEPYARPSSQPTRTWQIPPDSYFVMGDNRDNSSDSRILGAVGRDHIIGKAIFIYWPPEQWGLLGGAVYAAGN